MPIRCAGFEEARAALGAFFDPLDEDLGPVGEATARLIVSETRAGRGEDDKPFVPYSESYARQLRESGAKPDTPVDLHGAFAAGPGPGRKGSHPGIIRRPVRPSAPGVIDPNSELSADLIGVRVEDGRIELQYRPRSSPHMLIHQAGDGRMPQRTWFTLRRVAIKDALHDMLEKLMERYVRKFNR